MTDSKTPTHTAYTLKRDGKRFGRYLEVGNARQDPDGIIHVFLDRTPIGGFNGYVYLAPIGAQPSLSEPERSGEASEVEDD